MRSFNTTGRCIPSRHYIANIDEKLAQIKAMVDFCDQSCQAIPGHAGHAGHVEKYSVSGNHCSCNLYNEAISFSSMFGYIKTVKAAWLCPTGYLECGSAILP